MGESSAFSRERRAGSKERWKGGGGERDAKKTAIAFRCRCCRSAAAAVPPPLFSPFFFFLDQSPTLSFCSPPPLSPPNGIKTSPPSQARSRTTTTAKRRKTRRTRRRWTSLTPPLAERRAAAATAGARSRRRAGCRRCRRWPRTPSAAAPARRARALPRRASALWLPAAAAAAARGRPLGPRAGAPRACRRSTRRRRASGRGGGGERRVRFPGERPDASSPALSLLSPFFSPRAGVPAVAAVAFGVRQRGGETFFPLSKDKRGESERERTRGKTQPRLFSIQKKNPLTQPLGLLLRLEAQGQRRRKGQVLRLPARRGCFRGEQPQQQCEQQQRLRRRLFERRGGRRHRRLPCAPVGRKHQRAAAAAAPGRLLPPRRGVHGPELGPGGGADGARVREFLFSSKELQLFYERGV